MYTTLVADGSQIPPVIFTNDPNVPSDIEGRDDAHVLYVPNLTSSPSANVTLLWLDKVKDFLSDNPIIVHDAGKEFVNKKVEEEFHHFEIISQTIPGTGGAFLNPCDNSFHHDLKLHYYNKQCTTHAQMLKAMIDAYFEVSDHNIVSYFKYCKIIGKMATRKKA
jgi:hypothetical protein